MKKTKMNNLILLFELLIFILSSFLFLYINPSEDGRMRLIYISIQTVICTGVVFLLRLILGVFKSPKGENPSFPIVNLKILAADIIAMIVIYLIQRMVPEPMRITFLQIVFVIGFNLIVAAFSRIVYQAIYDWCEPYDKQWEEK